MKPEKTEDGGRKTAGRGRRLVRLSKSAEPALDLLLRDHQRMVFLESNCGSLDFNGGKWSVWIDSNRQPQGICVITERLPSAREAITPQWSCSLSGCGASA